MVQWNPKSPSDPFRFIVQSAPKGCVFASVAGAIDTAIGKDVWTEETLRQAWLDQGGQIGTQSFGNVRGVALLPVATEVELVHKRLDVNSHDELLSEVLDSVKNESIVVVSMVGIATYNTLNGQSSVPVLNHMLTFFGVEDESFLVWDSTVDRQFGRLTASELGDGFRYGYSTGNVPIDLRLTYDFDRLIVQRKKPTE